ncbi:hypothetical protein PMAYCL1PPCAC_04894, partial [Pristionchus mayeri]
SFLSAFFSHLHSSHMQPSQPVMQSSSDIQNQAPTGTAPAKGMVKKRRAVAKKQRVIEGKPPAQIINELYKGTTDTYDNDGKMVKCTLTVNDQVFQAVAAGKKNAKNEACMMALKSLCPDVHAEIENLNTTTGQPGTAPSKGTVKTPMTKKRRVVEGKPPAQIINEIYPGITDTYDNDGMMFKCTLTVTGQVFQAVASGKKNAKNEACMVALKSLCPDVHAEIESLNALESNTNEMDTDGQPQSDGQTTMKKRKVETKDRYCPVIALKGLLSKVCLEGNKKYKLDS